MRAWFAFVVLIVLRASASLAGAVCLPIVLLLIISVYEWPIVVFDSKLSKTLKFGFYILTQKVVKMFLFK